MSLVAPVPSRDHPPHLSGRTPHPAKLSPSVFKFHVLCHQGNLWLKFLYSSTFHVSWQLLISQSVCVMFPERAGFRPVRSVLPRACHSTRHAVVAWFVVSRTHGCRGTSCCSDPSLDAPPGSPAHSCLTTARSRMEEELEMHSCTTLEKRSRTSCLGRLPGGGLAHHPAGDFKGE